MRHPVDALVEEERELVALVESFDKTCTRYKMDISAETSTLITNSEIGTKRAAKVKRQKLGAVRSFKYVGAVSLQMMAQNQRFSQ